VIVLRIVEKPSVAAVTIGSTVPSEGQWDEHLSWMEGRVYIMKSYGIIIRMPLLIAMGIGLLVCSRPTPQQELPPTFEKTGLSNIRPIETMEQKYPQIAMAAQVGLVLLNREGAVIGVMFLTDRGDYFESRDGTHACFISRNHLENPSLKELAKNAKKRCPSNARLKTRGTDR
jgi:hypothetical protein